MSWSGALSTALSSLMANQLALCRKDQDAELANAISELTMSQQQLQATLAVGARTAQLTILDYLK